MAKKEKTLLEKKEWTSRFNIVGEAIVNDYTFALDQKSEKSDWVYNRLNLQIDCGEKYGKIGTELMGGYASERDNVVYVHGKKDDGSDDFTNQYTIDFDDRFDENILEDIGDLCFTTVGLEKTDKDKTFYKKFLSSYDMIAYINENLENGTVVNVSGQLKYSMYNGNLQCRKEITSIALSSATPEKYHATFTQTMLIDKDSCTKNDVDKDKSVLMVNAYILEKFKEFNGWDLTDSGKIKGGQFVPLRKTFEFPIDLSSEEGKARVPKILSKLFKVKKGVTQITFDGEFIESGATVQATLDDIPEDIKDLIDMGIYTEEEALAKCSENGSKERRMLILKPTIKMVGDDDGKKPVVQIFDEKFAEDDLILECLTPKDVDEDEEDIDLDVDDTENTNDSDEDIDWLDALD